MKKIDTLKLITGNYTDVLNTAGDYMCIVLIENIMKHGDKNKIYSCDEEDIPKYKTADYPC